MRHLLHRLGEMAAAMQPRLRPLRSDRGDSPVPSAIIIVGLALLAVAVVFAAGAMASEFLDQAPTQLPGFGD